MPNNATLVAVGKPKATGGIYAGPAGSILPTDVATVLDLSLKSVGYISDDGVTQTIATDSSDVKAWGGDTVRKIQTSHDVTYKYTMIETNEVSQKQYYGDGNVIIDAPTSSTGTLTEIHLTAEELPRGVRVLELKDGARIGRIVLPDAQVTERDDVSYKDDTSIAYSVTVTAYPDTDGVKSYIYWDDGVFSAA